MRPRPCSTEQRSRRDSVWRLACPGQRCRRCHRHLGGAGAQCRGQHLAHRGPRPHGRSGNQCPWSRLRKRPGLEFTEAGSGEVNRVALAVMAPSVLTYIGDHVAVFAGRQQCARRPGTALPADTHVLVTVAWTCPLDGGELRYRATLFHDVDPTARHLAIIATESGERELALDGKTRPRSLCPVRGRRHSRWSGGSSRPVSSTSFSATITSHSLPRSCFGRSVCGR